MKPRLIPYMLGFLMVLALPLTASAAQKQSDEQIKTLLVEQSRANYTGACPCPDNIMRNGKLCAGRSAYSKKNGKSILCSPADVTQEMINTHRTPPPVNTP